MKIEEDKKTWEILKEIKEKFDFQGIRVGIVWKRPNTDGNLIYETGEEGALAELEKLKAIKIYPEPVAMEKARKSAQVVNSFSLADDCLKDMERNNLCIMAGKNFDEVYRKYEKYYFRKMNECEQKKEGIFKMAPEFPGIGIDLKALCRNLKSWWTNKIK